MANIKDWIIKLDLDCDEVNSKIEKLEIRLLKLKELQKEVGISFKEEEEHGDKESR